MSLLASTSPGTSWTFWARRVARGSSWTLMGRSCELAHSVLSRYARHAKIGPPVGIGAPNDELPGGQLLLAAPDKTSGPASTYESAFTHLQTLLGRGGAVVPAADEPASTLTPLRSGSFRREVHVAFSSQRLAAARVAAGLTQQQLADAIGASKARVSEWERGQSAPRASRLPAVAQAVGVDPLELMAGGYEQLDLEALRMAAGLSRQALAAAVGLTLPRYQRMEAGERASDLPEDLVPVLARILSVPEVTVKAAAENARELGLRRRNHDAEAV